MTFEIANREAAAKVTAAGVTLYDWSSEDRAAFRAGAQKAWDNWAVKTPEAQALVDAHRKYMKLIGLLN